VDAELRRKLPHRSKCSGTLSLYRSAARFRLELGSFSASERGEIAFFVVRINVAHTRSATLPDLQVKPCLFPAVVDRRNTTNDHTEGKE